jgi:hypothetical protein
MSWGISGSWCERAVPGGNVTLVKNSLFSETHVRDPGSEWGRKSPRSLVGLRNVLRELLASDVTLTYVLAAGYISRYVGTFPGTNGFRRVY